MIFRPRPSAKLLVRHLQGEKGLRMDMVFLVEQHGRWRPLFVELKIEHKTGNDSPFSQLDAACTMVADQPEELRAFLSAASGHRGVPPIPETLIDVAIPRRLAVLPYLTRTSRMKSLWGRHSANRDLVRTFCGELVRRLVEDKDEGRRQWFFAEDISVVCVREPETGIPV